jgi:glycosyltransferase involved in cell wall biosynthesis
MVTICALIAAFNEERHVRQVVRDTRPHVSAVVVVDDGSTDATAAEAADAGARVLKHVHNMGKGRALRTGLEHVLRDSYSHVLFLDADMQHDPAEIPKLIEKAASGQGDFVLGEREFSKSAMPASRYYSNVIGSSILSRLIGARVTDSQSGFRLIRADLLRKIRLTARGYEIESEMLIKLARAGATLERVPVQRLQYTGVRSKIRPVRDTFRTCMLTLAYRYFSGAP